ncbi:MAG: 50S ribosomal protein L9 [Verrucomicrobia bacterium]|nr:50S ribosomal protein L9 [Verrucomicrobiota bacterium]MDE3099003.1 50S ribosomal protein L9 [Verrucomicrobiota bacterium]
MPKTEIILTHNIVGLGGESDQVKVAAGYARNYLFPQRLAIPLTMASKRQIEALKKRRAEREAHEFNAMSELAKGVQKLICLIKVKTGDDGRMFGTVTSGMIADELKHQFDISLDKKKIHLERSIKAVGDYEVELRLHPEVKGALKVRVESLTPITVPAAEAPAETKSPADRRPRTEKRGHGRPHEKHAGEHAAEPPKAHATDEKKTAKHQGEKPHKARPHKTAKAEKKADQGE